MSNSLPKKKPGQTFVRILILFTLFWIALYIVSHLFIDSDGRFACIKLQDAYRLTPQGEFIILDPVAINWSMGETNATPILKRLDQRTGKIRNLMGSVRTDAERLRRSLAQETSANIASKDNPVVVINSALDKSRCRAEDPHETDTFIESCGVWSDAYADMEKLSVELTQLPGMDETNNVINRLLRLLSELKQQANEQYADAAALKPSRARTFFWSSPAGSSVEVIFFAVFGVLANLLVNSAEYLRLNNFKQGERWVAYTKLVYGPILAWILVTAIAVGWFDLGEYSLGTYSLPLLAFILGFYSRKTVGLLDKFGNRVLGEAEKSIERGPAEIAAKHRAYMDQFMHSIKPRNIAEIKKLAFDVKDEIIKTIVLEKEARK
jgi:hypothetical protein